MQEKVFKVSYIPYLKKEKFNRTSFLWQNIKKHKIIITLLSIIILASSVNFVLVYNFLKILETLG